MHLAVTNEQMYVVSFEMQSTTEGNNKKTTRRNNNNNNNKDNWQAYHNTQQ